MQDDDGAAPDLQRDRLDQRPRRRIDGATDEFSALIAEPLAQRPAREWGKAIDDWNRRNQMRLEYSALPAIWIGLAILMLAIALSRRASRALAWPAALLVLLAASLALALREISISLDALDVELADMPGT